MVTVGSWLHNAASRLNVAGVPSARLDCLILLESTLRKDRSWLLAHADEELPDSYLSKLARQVERRSRHEPLAYIRGKTEFYGREILVNKHVLEPRPETETMVELLLQLFDLEVRQPAGMAVIADIGTGSGCLAVTAKLELPKTRVLAIDIDARCLKLAARNAAHHNAAIEVMKGDLLEPLLDCGIHPGIVLANLPYVPDHFTLNSAAMNEPRKAIFGGPDGLSVYRRMFQQIKGMTGRPSHLFTESLPTQHQNLSNIADSAGYVLVETKDFIQSFAVAR